MNAEMTPEQELIHTHEFQKCIEYLVNMEDEDLLLNIDDDDGVACLEELYDDDGTDEMISECLPGELIRVLSSFDSYPTYEPAFHCHLGPVANHRAFDCLRPNWELLICKLFQTGSMEYIDKHFLSSMSIVYPNQNKKTRRDQLHTPVVIGDIAYPNQHNGHISERDIGKTCLPGIGIMFLSDGGVLVNVYSVWFDTVVLQEAYSFENVTHHQSTQKRRRRRNSKNKRNLVLRKCYVHGGNFGYHELDQHEAYVSLTSRVNSLFPFYWRQDVHPMSMMYLPVKDQSNRLMVLGEDGSLFNM